MITAIAAIKGTSALSWSKVIATPKDPKETHDDHENRTWRERMHTTDDGQFYIPPTALKNSLSEAAKYLTKKVPGGKNATYTKHFEAGVLCVEPIILPIAVADVVAERLFVPADGRRGGKTRVWRNFPYIPSGWEGEALYSILDPLITRDVFAEHLEECGKYIGIGRFRPRNNGYYGRFAVLDILWQEA